jgi:signal transduction histidine kinase
MATTARDTPPDLYASHPLELIPFFRGWPCGFWRDVVYTFIFNTLMAGVFALLSVVWSQRYGFAELLWLNFVFAQCVGYSLHTLYLIIEALVPRAKRRTRGALALFWGVVPIVGVTIGYAIAATLLGWTSYRTAMFTPRGLSTIAVMSLMITGVLAAMIVPRARAAQAEAEIAKEQARVAAAEREAALAQLKALEAQVEPHFLYNTLAHVSSLIDADPKQARGMLDRLIALLRATAKAGNGGATLGSQADLLRAYLDILGMRMGSRLEWTIDVPPSLADVALPPALLQPLVENAIKHGLEPKIEGGSIAIAAHAVGDRLELTVTDTGKGFGSTTTPIGGSTQVGISVLKQRLAALYGEAATLTIAENRPTGVRVTLAIPFSATR